MERCSLVFGIFFWLIFSFSLCFGAEIWKINSWTSWQVQVHKSVNLRLFRIPNYQSLECSKVWLWAQHFFVFLWLYVLGHSSPYSGEIPYQLEITLCGVGHDGSSHITSAHNLPYWGGVLGDSKEHFSIVPLFFECLSDMAVWAQSLNCENSVTTYPCIWNDSFPLF